MSGPDFDDLVGEEVTGAERERLFAAHRALLAAGAPPELSPRLEHPPKPPSARVVRLPQRRRFAALVAAAAVAAVVFAAGFTGGWVGRGGFASVVGPVRMEGTAATVTAAVLRGADVVRVHDVREMTRVVRIADRMR